MLEISSVNSSGNQNIVTLEVLVLSLHGLKMIQDFFIRVLQFEEFSAQRSRLFLGTFQFTLRLLILLLPLSQDLLGIYLGDYLFASKILKVRQK